MSYTRINPQPADGARTLAQLGLSITRKGSYTFELSMIRVYGKVLIAKADIGSSNAISANVNFNPAQITGLAGTYGMISGAVVHGHMSNVGNLWIRFEENVSAGDKRDCTFIAFLP